MNLELNGHTAVIVGGASGIGLATATGFAAEGASVAIWDCSPATADVARSLSAKFSVPALGVTVDITDQQAVESATQETLAELHRVDHLVHSAAVGSGKYGFPFTRLQPDDWRRVLEVNVMGTTILAHAVVPQLIQQGSGTIVLVASVAGQIGSQTDPPYSASKAANINFGQCLAKDLAPHGIRVNTVCPGMVRTALNKAVWQAWHDQSAPGGRLDYDVWADRKIRSVSPLGTWQTPQAIADTILFLSSVRSQFTTGQTINVDGGQVMHS